MATGPDPLIAKLATKKDKIAKLPEKMQRQLYGFAFSQSVKPRLSALGTGGEDTETARERFINSQIGAPQQPVADVVPKPSTMEKVGATIQAAGAGVATRAKQALEFFQPGLVPSTLGAVPGMSSGLNKVLTQAESKYANAATIAPKAAPIAAMVGHAIPEVAAWEAIGPLGGAGRVGRALAGAASQLPFHDDRSAGSFARDTVGIAIFDALTHGMWKGSDKAYTAVREAVAQRGQKVSKEAVAGISQDIADTLKQKYPERWAMVNQGKKITDVLTPEEHSNLLDEAQKKFIDKQNAAKAVVKEQTVADRELKRVNKEAEKFQAKQAAAAQKLAARDAAKASAKAFQSKLVAFRKATGAVPQPGTPEYAHLASGGSVEELIASRSSQAIQGVNAVADRQTADAIAEIAPQAVEAVRAVQTVPKIETPKIEPVEPLTPHAQFKTNRKAIQEKIAAPAEPHAYEKFGIKLDPTTWTTPEDVINGKEAAVRELQRSAKEKAGIIQQAISDGGLTSAQGQVALTKLTSEILKANLSIEKIKSPQISAKARDRLRKGAEAFEAKRAEGVSQMLQERAAGSFDDAIIAVDKYVKALRTLGHGNVVKVIEKTWKDSGSTDNKDLAELLQTAFERLTKKQ